MNFYRLKTTEDKYFKEAMKLYQVSFPEFEQRYFDSQVEVMKREAYHCEVICDGDQFAGILFYWKIDEVYYIEHFAVTEALRGRNVGSRALGQFCATKQNVVLEIDLPINEIEKRRKVFYERLGFVENDYAHKHPAYRSSYQPHELMIMSYPKALTPKRYEDFKDYLENKIMK